MDEERNLSPGSSERQPIPAPTRRKRWLWRIGIALLLLITLFIIEDVFTSLPLFNNTNNPIPATPTTPPNTRFFYVPKLPSWGNLKIDGKQLEHLPTQDTNDPLPLAFGQHQVQWEAKPFRTYTCTLQVPPSTTSDACPTQLLHGSQDTFLITLPISLDLLPDDQQQRLIEVTQQALDDAWQSSETVSEGEAYTFATLSGVTPHKATEPLIATHRLLLHTSTDDTSQCEGLSLGQGCTMFHQDCHRFCTPAIWPTISPELPQWNVMALFHEKWEYYTKDGISIQPSEAEKHAPHNDHYVAFRVIWQNEQWSVQFYTEHISSFDDPLCVTLIDTLLKESTYTNPPQLNERVSWSYVSDPQHSASCLGAGYRQDDIATKPTRSPSLGLLQRFGVLLATNEESQQVWPDLPLATGQASQQALSLVQKAQP